MFLLTLLTPLVFDSWAFQWISCKLVHNNFPIFRFSLIFPTYAIRWSKILKNKTNFKITEFNICYNLFLKIFNRSLVGRLKSSWILDFLQIFLIIPLGSLLCLRDLFSAMSLVSGVKKKTNFLNFQKKNF